MSEQAFSFPGGVRVYSQRTGELLDERGDEPLWIHRGRLVLVRDQAVLYSIRRARWVTAQFATMLRLTHTQSALGPRQAELAHRDR